MNDNQTPPDKPGNSSGAPGTTASNTSHTGATTISEATTASSQAYTSATGGENALLVTGGESTLTDAEITKTGDESSENSDFYGTNAAVLATGGSLTLDGGSVTTSGAHANGIFAYGSGKIVVKNTTVKTTSNNSGGIMVTGGGTLTAEDLTVTTSGNSSAPIRSDRGSGTMTITGGSFTSSGVGSPAIYSTANISVIEAELTSTASEGVVIEGSNSVSLENVTLTDTNNTLNGNSETYKNIFIYQSMSGDAEAGTGVFSATNSTITTNQGDTFFITNTTADIRLTNNKFINNDTSSALLRAGAGKWGTAGSNGGHVKLTLSQQVAEGDIILDNLSTLSLVLSDSSFYMGTINGSNTASSVNVTIDATSQLILAGDTYLTSLDNADADNMNIYSNGYKLYVAGGEVEVNGSEAPTAPEATVEEKTDADTTGTVVPSSTPKQETDYTPFIVGGAAILVIILAVVAFVSHNKKKNTPSASVAAFPPQDGMTPQASQTPPDFSQFDDSQSSQQRPPMV